MELPPEGLLNIESRAKQLRLNHMHKVFNNKCPTYMETNFTKVSRVHDHNTRQGSSNIHVPRVNNNIQKDTFYYSGTLDWNSLPLEIKMIPNIQSFKHKVKQYLIHNNIRLEASPVIYQK